jgi:hypothetical protein
VNSSTVALNYISRFSVDDNKPLNIPNSTPAANLSIATAGAAACISENDQFFHLFGGSPKLPTKPTNQSCTNQVSIFDVVRLKWTVWPAANTTGTAPTPRDRATIVDFNGTLVVFGGSCDGLYNRDVYRFNYKTGSWSRDQVNGSRPIGRRGHIAYIDPSLPNPTMIMFGGYNAAGVLSSEVWAYDLVQLSWSSLSPVGGPVPGRKDTAAAYALGRLLFFGGAGNATILGDLWQFVHQSDCFSHLTCQACANVDGCGWCWNNAKGYQCVSGSHNSLYISGSCQGSPASTAFTNDPLICPSNTFPSWAIALIVIGGVLIIGIIVFAVMKMRKSNEYEEIQ